MAISWLINIEHIHISHNKYTQNNRNERKIRFEELQRVKGCVYRVDWGGVRVWGGYIFIDIVSLVANYNYVLNYYY